MNNAQTTSPPTQRSRVLRWTALICWVLIALLNLVFFLFDLQSDYSDMLVPCAGAACNFLAISSAEMAVLASWGVAPQAYALYVITGTMVVVLVYWALSGLILWQEGPSRLGLFVSLALIVVPVSMFSGSNDWSASNPNLSFLGVIVSILGSAIIIVFFYLMPNGRFSPRWASVPLLSTILLISVLTMEINGILTLSTQALSLVEISLIVLVLLAGVFQIYRYLRDSNSAERQQTKWILFGLLAIVLSVIVWVLVYGGALDIPAGKTRLLANIVGGFLNLALITMLPVTITIAILRYKLWDIDLIIRKTLVYTVLTGTLALVYFGLVILLQSVFESISDEQSPIAIVISTLVIAAMFAPLRRRVQNFIDRRFFRQKYDAQLVLAHFAQTARDETDIEVLTAELVQVVQETLQPENVHLWMNP